MLKRILILLSVSCSVVGAADNAPSEASIKELLLVGNAHKLVDSMMAQMDSFMKNAMQQATKGQTVTPQI